jgi:hypothetical protein
MLTVADELPHQILASDPNWRESWYLNFFDHEQEIYGIAWMGIRPNVKRGEILFAIGKGDELLYKLEEFDVPIDPDIGRERTSFGPLSWRVVEPYRTWELRFAGDIDVELRWDALTQPYNFEWQADQRSWHYQHFGNVEGRIAIGDREWTIAGHGARDRAWGRRANNVFGSLHWVTAKFENGVCYESQHISYADRTELYGAAHADGRSSLLTRVEIEPVYDGAGGPPIAARILAADRDGRSFEMRQENLSVIPMGDEHSRQYFTFNRYTLADGAKGYGMMDHWWGDTAMLADHYVCTEPNLGRLWPVGPWAPDAATERS